MTRVVVLKPPKYDGKFVNYENNQIGSAKAAPETPFLLPQLAAEVDAIVGAEVISLDAQMEGLTSEALVERLKDIGPDLVIIPFYVFNVDRERHLFDLEFPTMAISLPLSIPPEEVISRYGIQADYYSHSDPCVQVRRLVQAFATGAQPPADLVPGKGFRSVKLSKQDLADAYASSPAPLFEQFHLDNYLAEIKRCSGKRVFHLRMSNGCPFRCAFCGNGAYDNRRFYAYPLDYVKRLLHAALDNNEVDAIRFKDGTFSADRSYAVSLLDYIHETFPNVRLRITERVSTLDEAYLDYLASRNVSQIGIGIETVDPVVQKHINKIFDRDKAVRLYRYAHKIGIRMDAYLTIGLPGETPHSIDLLKEFIEDIYPQEVSCCPLYIHPGSTLYQRCSGVGDLRHDDWERFLHKDRLLYRHDAYESLDELNRLNDEILQFARVDVPSRKGARRCE